MIYVGHVMSEECNGNTNILICYSKYFCLVVVLDIWILVRDSGQKNYQDVLLWRDGGSKKDIVVIHKFYSINRGGGTIFI